MMAGDGAEARRLRVLVVEDESIVAMMLEDMLAELGHQVVGPAARLDPALELARTEAIDVAVLDLNLAGREVYPVAEELDRRGVPFIFATGYGNQGIRAPYQGRPTIQKPFQLRALVQAIGGAAAG